MVAERSVATAPVAAGETDDDDTGLNETAPGSTTDGEEAGAETWAPGSSPVAKRRTRTMRMMKTMTRRMKRKKIHRQHGPAAVGHVLRCRSTPVDR